MPRLFPNVGGEEAKMVRVLVWTVLMSFANLSGALAQPATHLELHLSGGLHAGSYTLTSPDSHCLVGGGEAERWDVLLGDDAPPPGGLGVVVLSVTPSGQLGGASDFSLIAGFGAFNTDAYTEYVLEPVNGSGMLEREGREQARIEVMGEPADGVGLRATLTCHEVLDLNIRGP